MRGEATEPFETSAEARAERLALLEEVFKAAPTFLHVVRGPQFILELANEAYYRLVGRRDLIGKPAFEAIPEAAHAGYEERISRVMATHEPFFGREMLVTLVRVPGEPPEERIIDLVFLPLVDPDGTCTRVLGHGTDVTDLVRARTAAEQAQRATEESAALMRQSIERARAAAALRESETRFRTLFESIDEGLCIVEVIFDGNVPVDYRFVETNPAFVHQTGIADAVGKRMKELAPAHEAHWFEIYGRIAITGEAARFEARAEALGRWFDVYAFRIGEPRKRHVAILFNDVSDRRRADAERERLLAAAESARQEAEAANRAKSEFLAVMSHELRTPLNAIGGYVDLLELGIRGPLSELQRQDLSRIQQSQRHLLGLINQVLNYTRVDAGVLRYDIVDVPLGGALAAAEALVLPQVRAHGLTYMLGAVSPTLAVRADRDKLQQILLNLLSNAIKFTEPGGEVRVTCAEREGFVAISVADTGIGIAPEKLAHIFEPFVQVNQRLTRPHDGIGLGLAISRDLARGMRGDLTAESEAGRGSVFTATLPIA